MRSSARLRSFAVRSLALVAVLAAAGPAFAHDFWIEPTTHRPAAKALVGVTLRVGDEIPGDAVPRTAERIERFALAGMDGDVPVVGRDGETPAGAVRVAGEGLQWLVYRSRRSSIRLPAEKFEAYLKEEGLERIVEARAKRGASKAEGREVYSRCAKSLLVVQGEAGKAAAALAGHDRALGLTLELVL